MTRRRGALGGRAAAVSTCWIACPCCSLLLLLLMSFRGVINGAGGDCCIASASATATVAFVGLSNNSNLPPVSRRVKFKRASNPLSVDTPSKRSQGSLLLPCFRTMRNGAAAAEAYATASSNREESQRRHAGVMPRTTIGATASSDDDDHRGIATRKSRNSSLTPSRRSKSPPKDSSSVASVGSRAAASFLVAVAILFAPSFAPDDPSGMVPAASSIPVPVRPALAADYGSLTAEQRAVAEAWRLVDYSYVDRTFNDQDWFRLRQDAVKRRYKNMDEARAAIDDMLTTLGDKYTRYLTPAKYQSIFDSATGTLAGVGIEISKTSSDGDGTGSTIAASDVEDDSPASRAGIRPGDVFVEVDGLDATGSGVTPDDVASKLRGPEGSKVGVVMDRGGKKIDLILTREKITITSVKSYLSDKSGVGKVGVVKIKSFSGTTAKTVSDALAGLKKKGASAFVFDLRNNPGGLLPGGVETASLFLDGNKPVVFVVNKNGVVDAQETLSPGIDLDDPIVVLVNGNTASAAEVFSAALKENGRATIAGERTFGKGVVQTVKPLSNDNGGVAVTVARYETPKHNDINKRGIAVDVPVSLDDCSRPQDAASCVPSSAFRNP